MKRSTSLVSLNQISEINLTPLMDLTFILLITFVITFPLMEQGVPLNLPQGEAQDLPKEETLAISIDAEGQYFLAKEALPFERLKDRLGQVARTQPRTLIRVRADREVPYGRVADVMTALNQAQLQRVALVTQPQQGDESR